MFDIDRMLTAVGLLWVLELGVASIFLIECFYFPKMSTASMTTSSGRAEVFREGQDCFLSLKT